MGGGDLVSEGAQGWGKTEAGDLLRLGTEIGGGGSGYSCNAAVGDREL